VKPNYFLHPYSTVHLKHNPSFFSVPAHGDHVLRLVQVVPAWRDRPHVGREVGELAVLVHRGLGAPLERVAAHLSVTEFSVHIIGHRRERLNLTLLVIPLTLLTRL